MKYNEFISFLKKEGFLEKRYDNYLYLSKQINDFNSLYCKIMDDGNIYMGVDIISQINQQAKIEVFINELKPDFKTIGLLLKKQLLNSSVLSNNLDDAFSAKIDTIFYQLENDIKNSQ